MSVWNIRLHEPIVLTRWYNYVCDNYSIEYSFGNVPECIYDHDQRHRSYMLDVYDREYDREYDRRHMWEERNIAIL